MNTTPDILGSEKFWELSWMFLKAAKKLDEMENRFYGFYYPSYYLLTHALELALKFKILQNNGVFPRRHDLSDLVKIAKKYHVFSDEDMDHINYLNGLNSGPGGLRYPNENEYSFLPSVFERNSKIARDLLGDNL